MVHIDVDEPYPYSVAPGRGFFWVFLGVFLRFFFKGFFGVFFWGGLFGFS